MAKNNVPKSIIMDQFSIGKSTLNDILRSEEKFKAEKEELGLTKAAKQKVEGGWFDKLHTTIYIWFCQQREKGCPVTGPILLEKASEFHRLIYGEHSRSFLASTGFQYRFQKMFGLRNLKICGEKISSDSSSAEQFINEFIGITKDYSKYQIFNCNETGRILLQNVAWTYHSISKRPTDGTKKAKDRVTINACANASGTIKLPLLLIGKAKNPHCFRNMKKEAMPVVYRNQANAWVSRDIFKDCFFNCFVLQTKQRLRELRQEERAILFFDNCSAHPSKNEFISADSKITAKFLPSNVTALLQPMDQGVLESIKRVYRKLILRDLVSQSTLSYRTF